MKFGMLLESLPEGSCYVRFGVYISLFPLLLIRLCSNVFPCSSSLTAELGVQDEVILRCPFHVFSGV